jgi:drug/metabolite transporter (DMT)-like permease
MKTFGAGASRHGYSVVNRQVLPFNRPRIAARYWLWVFMLVTATMFWGFGNVAQKIALQDISPLTLLFMRSLIAVVCLAPFAIWECRRKRINLQQIWQSRGLLAITSASFAFGLAFQTFGGQFTSATNVGFLVNLCMLITPLLLFFIFGEKIRRLTLISCAICFGGAALLTGLQLQAPNFGDALCFAGAIFYAVWIIALDRTLKTIDAPILITTLQFVPTCVIGAGLTFPYEKISIADFSNIWPALFFVCVMSTSVGFLLASYAQRIVIPVVASIIYSFEALFGAFAAYFVLGERMSPSAMLGGGLMFASILACQYRANAGDGKKIGQFLIPGT